MINPFKEVNWNPGLRERRRFAVSLMVGFPCVAVLILLGRRLFAGEWNLLLPGVLATGGVIIGIVLWLLPQVAKPIYVLWYGVACAISIVVGNALFLAFYFTVVTAVGWLARTLGKTSIRKARAPAATTYWRDAGPMPRADQYYSQF